MTDDTGIPTTDKNRDVGTVGDGEAHGFPTEFLDDTSDAHAMFFGFWKGLRDLKPKRRLYESRKEPHYFMLGYLLGQFVKIGVFAVAAEAASGTWLFAQAVMLGLI